MYAIDKIYTGRELWVRGGDHYEIIATRVHALNKLIKSNATFANKFCMNVAYIKYKTPIPIHIHSHTHTQTI